MWVLPRLSQEQVVLVTSARTVQWCGRSSSMAGVGRGETGREKAWRADGEFSRNGEWGNGRAGGRDEESR